MIPIALVIMDIIMKTILVSLPRWAKNTLQAVFDILTLSFSYFWALVLSNGTLVSAAKEWDLMVLLISLPLCIGLFFCFGAYRPLVRYSSSKTMAQLMAVYAGSTLSFWGITWILTHKFNWIPVFIFFLLVCSIGIGARFIVRSYLRSFKNHTKENALIYGAGELGRQLLGNIQQGHQLQPVGFIDDSAELIGRIISGVPIFHTSDLPKLLAEKSVSVILIAMQNVPKDVHTKLANIVSQKSVTIQKIPAVADILSGRTKITNFHEVKIEDLLGRKPVAAIPWLLDANTSDKSVLVTGAGGSIGSEICRQIMQHRPSRLVLLEASEHALYQIEREIEKTLDEQGLTTEVVSALVNVCDTNLLTRVLRDNRVQTVFHAAAYKHVPMLENNVLAALSNNIIGTKSVVEASIKTGVLSLTMISTDKAVRPTNVMGASKRFAELICQAYAQKQHHTKISMVRFGNVLGSSGSVVPLFRSQIKNGGPVTVTHRDITRYFMTIPEASQLVIQASGMASGGEVFVLDMGKPIRILDLARSMVHLSGYQPFIQGEQAPDSEAAVEKMEIVISNLRPGEKLYEELLVDAVAEGTKHPRIMRAKEQMLGFSELQPELNYLQTCVETDNELMAIDLLHRLPLEYQPPTGSKNAEHNRRPMLRRGVG